MAKEGLAAILIPRADAHQGEYVAPCDERLAWLTGFTGSAGFCIVLAEIAGVFVDGRYRTQVKAQVDTAHYARGLARNQARGLAGTATTAGRHYWI